MIKKIYLEDHNQVLEDIKDSFEITNNWLEADAIVVWQDVRGELVQIVANANLIGIPTIVMQHGLRASRDYDSIRRKLLIAQKIMVWGDKDKERILETGWVEPDRIVVTGTTIFDHLKPKQKHEGVNVLFVPLHWDKEISENYEIAEKLAGVRGINVTTKTIEGQDISHYQNVITSHRDEKNHLEKIAEILKTADVLVSVNESTLEFMAYYLDIPVITVDNWKPKRLLDTFVDRIDKDFSDACERVRINDLEEAINLTLANPGKKTNERKAALKDEAGVGIDVKPAKERIIDAICRLDEEC